MLHQYFNAISPIEEKHFKMLQEKFIAKLFAKGDEILSVGQTQSEIYFIEQGIQMSYLQTVRKKIVVGFTYAPGICAVPDSFAFQQPSKYSVVCLEDSKFQSLTFNDLNEAVDRSRPLERWFNRYTTLVLAGLIDRHIDRQALSIQERFLSFAKRSPHLLLRVPHKYLASYLDIDPTNFSKLYNSVKI